MIIRVLFCALVGALTLTAVSMAVADDMSKMKGMDRTGVLAAKHGSGVGVIKAIDVKNDALTIQHGPIPAVAWPAMTMTFRATPPALLTGLKVGQTIGFDVTVRGVAASVTAIRRR